VIPNGMRVPVAVWQVRLRTAVSVYYTLLYFKFAIVMAAKGCIAAAAYRIPLRLSTLCIHVPRVVYEFVDYLPPPSVLH